MTRANDLEYELPPDRIAQHPSPERDRSRALFVTRGDDGIEEGEFRDILGRLHGDECFVVNDTAVIPARIHARRASGGKVEVFLLRPEGSDLWRAWISPSRRIRPGESLVTDDASTPIEVHERIESFWLVRFGGLDALEAIGEVPLPPYIERGERADGAHDRDRYQTVYARRPGAVAAPTAGLHFTPELLGEIEARGIPIVKITLHVGPGTFQPIRAEELDDHEVLPELYEVDTEARAGLAAAAAAGRKIICVGTTSLRCLESIESLTEGEEIRGETSLTIVPGYRFRHAAGLITNFHLPRSSLLALVGAFHGLERTLAVYRHAVEHGLRFYSYGDAMAILPERAG